MAAPVLTDCFGRPLLQVTIVSSTVLKQSVADHDETDVLGGGARPFTAYIIEARTVNRTWQVQRRVENFLSLQDELSLSLQVPAIPSVSTLGEERRDNFQHRSPFVQMIRASLQKWLDLLLKRADILESIALRQFLEIPATKPSPPPQQQPPQQAPQLLPQPAAPKRRPKRPEESERPLSARKKVSLEDFALMKVIGKGSFGKVIQVRRIDSGRVYAMKVLKKDFVLKRKQVAHTRTERAVLEHMRHPFIVALHFAFQTRSKLYFVLDFCAGGELFFHLARAGKFTEERARFYAAEIVLALEYLHSHGVVYRDLKPENCLLDDDGHVRLTDFGLSKAGVDFEGGDTTYSFCGTPEYLAPEVLRRVGHNQVADWWSLGALLYEMLTGIPPFYSRDRKRLFKQILERKLQFPVYFSPAVKSLLRGLMSRDPLQRLGAHGAEEIKMHPFFNEIDWDLLEQRKVTPPFRPIPEDESTERSASTTEYFDDDFTNLPVESPGASVDMGAAGDFRGFTYDVANDDTALAQSVRARRTSSELDLFS
ncbi:MAG: hypothetical protein MHM6MM_005293 [Cercozoa sp. M6MM]